MKINTTGTNFSHPVSLLISTSKVKMPTTVTNFPLCCFLLFRIIKYTV